MNSIAMPLTAQLLLAFLAGGVVGRVFCLVLWQGIQSLASGPAAGMRALLGAVLRTAVAAACLVLVGGGDWRATVAALVGFALLRSITTRRIARPPP